ncbi:MAG: hypothetical protein KAX38_02355, partial [Candidatus Krumholzibacteria bacterium]|nr:hypothetical protein [Candidatus Krumholzibacteria bacterium]
DAGIVNFGADAGAEITVNSDMVIDHGGTWGSGDSLGVDFSLSGESAVEPAVDSAAEEMERLDSSDVTLGEVKDSIQETPDPGVSDVEPTVSEVPLDGQNDSCPAESESGEGWIEMPGHRWVKIDIEKAEHDIDKGPVEVEVKDAQGSLGESPQEDFSAERGVHTEELVDLSSSAGISDASKDDEPVYDLFELGAVEYVEETQSQR